MKNLQKRTAESLEYLRFAFAVEPALKEEAKQFSQLENLRDTPELLEITRLTDWCIFN